MGVGGQAAAQPAPEQVPADGPDRFMRIFDGLPPFAEASDALNATLAEVGAAGGIMDAGNPGTDNLFLGAGHTFLGQFLDHDLTSDAESTLGVPAAIERSVNTRSARLDLDSVYAGGPTISPALFEPDDQALFRVGFGGRYEDLPRDADGLAIVGDSRNDENLIIGGLHVAFLLFHNAVVADLRTNGGDVDLADSLAVFVEAQRIVRWHYQWLIVNELLPLFVGQALVDEVLADGRQIYVPTEARIPVEFQVAAYRFGHALVQASYTANDDLDAPVFDITQDGVADPDDLRGGQRGARRWVDWGRFFDFGTPMRHNRRIGTTIASPLLDLPMFAIDTTRGQTEGPTSLASRNLQRHVTWGIPSGQAIAAQIGAPPVGRSNFADLAPYGLDQSTPLWFYILREADKHANGTHLGPVGGRIVAEVFIGLLELDPESYLSADPGWQPTLPTLPGSEFGIRDVLRIAGVDPASRSAGGVTEVSVEVSCLNADGRLDVYLQNSTAVASTYAVTVGRVSPRTVTVAAGGTEVITVTGRRDGPIDVTVARDGVEIFSSTEIVACDPVLEAAVATSCAAGNGRFDVALRNTASALATYTVRCNGLAPRIRELAPGESQVVIITGRRDGTYQIIVERDGIEILSSVQVVDCDPIPDDEVTLATSCLAGNGRIDVDLYNSSDQAVTYTVNFGALIPRIRVVPPASGDRVTATGRRDGVHVVVVRRDDQVIVNEPVTISCDI